MSIRVVCQQCQKQFSAPDHLAGKRVACPGCQSPLVIGAAPAAASPLDLLDDAVAMSQGPALATGADAAVFAPSASRARPALEGRSLKWFFSFDGRIPRSQFWLYYGSALLLLIVASVVANAATLLQIIFLLLAVGLIVPMIALQVKRWHDLDKSGWWVLINFIPFVGGLISLVMLGAMPGTQGSNKYGPDPLR